MNGTDILTPVRVDDEVIDEIRKHARALGLASWNDVLRVAFSLPIAQWHREKGDES